MESHKVREKLVSWLKEAYEVKDISSGSGVPKLSRLEVTAGGTTLRYAVKISGNTGRISFSRDKDGNWKVLSEVDRVLYGYVSPENPLQLQIMTFYQKTVLKAFESTFQELQKIGQSHIPIWLSPVKEEGLRFYGSGFKDKLHVEPSTVQLSESPLNREPNREIDAEDSAQPTKDWPGLMDEVKSLFAAHLGIDAKKVEIEVKIRP